MNTSVFLIALLIPLCGGICILVPVIVCIVRKCRNRGAIPMRRSNYQRNKPILGEVIMLRLWKKYPKEQYSTLNNKFNIKNCTICLEEYKEGVMVADLKCKHLFHTKCLEQWVLTNAKSNHMEIRCPNCNASIL